MGRGLQPWYRAREAEAVARLSVGDTRWVQFHGMRRLGHILSLGRHHALVAMDGRTEGVWVRATCCRESDLQTPALLVR